MATKLLDSFCAVYLWLDRPSMARRAVAALLVLQTLLLAYSAYVHSPTFNEPAHLVAGLSNWKFGRFDVYSANPPLVQMIAALPVMAVGYKEDWTAFYEGSGARPEMAMGAAFVKANGERSFFLFMLARWACIPLSWIGAIICYLWARDMYGRPAGILASTIWSFEPNVLAHASLVTNDAHAAALGLAASFTFWLWLKKPTWTQAVLAGVILGLAELTKTTLIILFPLWTIMWLGYRWPERRSLPIRDWLRQAGMLVVGLAIGVYVLNLGYVFEGSFTQLKKLHFVSSLLSGSHANSRLDGEITELSETEEHPISDNVDPSLHNRFAGTCFGELYLPFPENYVLGIDVQQHDFENYGRPSYLHGQWRRAGWWYYYLYACAIKVPIAIWLLGLFVLAARLGARFLLCKSSSKTKAKPVKSPIDRSQLPTAAWRDELMLLIPGTLIFALASSKTGFSEHMRYILPALPYYFILVSQAVPICIKLSKSADPFYFGHGNPYRNCARSDQAVLTLPRRGRLALFSAILVAWLSAWMVTSSLCVYPHCLSYFNETIGGPIHGPAHLLGSNVDWGQDLLYLLKWCRNHPGANGIRVAYHGPFDPNDVEFSRPRSWPTNAESTQEGAAITNKALCAISATLLYDTWATARLFRGESYKLTEQEILKLRYSTPRLTFGYSIYCFEP